MCPLASLLAIVLVIDAPPSLAPAAARVRAIDQEDLRRALGRAGLQLPAEVRVTLVSADAPLARQTPAWIVGRAFGSRDVTVFPDRVTRYPYDSLESVMRHEVVHLALGARAGGRPLPRWFHEGVATTVEAGWGAADQLRLLVATLRDPTIDDLAGLFASDAQPHTELAYRLSAALAADLRERHGADVPGRIASHVADGNSFVRAFAMETGETPDAAAARAWRGYRRWTTWVPAVASVSGVWTLTLALALLAFIVRWRRRARRHRLWDDEERFDRGPGTS